MKIHVVYLSQMYLDLSLCTSVNLIKLTVNRSEVDDVRQKLTVLQPMKGNITNILIMGTFKWQDV